LTFASGIPDIGTFSILLLDPLLFGQVAAGRTASILHHPWPRSMAWPDVPARAPCGRVSLWLSRPSHEHRPGIVALPSQHTSARGRILSGRIFLRRFLVALVLWSNLHTMCSRTLRSPAAFS